MMQYNDAMQIQLGWCSGKLHIDFGGAAYAKTLPYEHVTIFTIIQKHVNHSKSLIIIIFLASYDEQLFSKLY